jgi:hypothetical protein
VCDIYEVTQSIDGTDVQVTIDENYFCYQDCDVAGQTQVDYDRDGDGLKSADEFIALGDNTNFDCGDDPDCDGDLFLDGAENQYFIDRGEQVTFGNFDVDQGGEPDGAEVLGGSAGERDPLDSADDLTLEISYCGDGVCQSIIEGTSFESSENCLADCWCGNYKCEETESATGEDANGNPLTFCPSDCYCGNDTCDANETAENCAVDCGDGTNGDTSGTGDLNPTQPDPNQTQCNENGECEEGETAENCASDCAP